MARDEMQIGESRGKGQTTGQASCQASEIDQLRADLQRSESARRSMEDRLNRIESQGGGKPAAAIDPTHQQLDREQAAESRRQAKETEIVQRHEAEDRSISDNSLWWVMLTPSDGRTTSPYLDVPRIFHCEKHEAMDRFMHHYNIQSTEHRFTVQAATKEQWMQQRARDKAARTSGQHFSCEQIMAEAGLAAPVAA